MFNDVPCTARIRPYLLFDKTIQSNLEISVTFRTEPTTVNRHTEASK